MSEPSVMTHISTDEDSDSDSSDPPPLQPVQTSDSDEPFPLVTSELESGYDGQSSCQSDILLPESDFDSTREYVDDDTPRSAANAEPDSDSDSSEPQSDSDSDCDGQQLSPQCRFCSMARRVVSAPWLPETNFDSTPEYVGDDKPRYAGNNKTYSDSDGSGDSDSDGPPPLQPVPPSDSSDYDSMPRLVTNSECGSESSYDGPESSYGGQSSCQSDFLNPASDFDSIPESVDDDSSRSDDSTRIRQRIRQLISQYESDGKSPF
ncbi:MAG: hypothetical protein GY799_20315 [Desulfobulbaceae bacterium]|nr:hypothetical protein [Desulfobulbaceae bacterium]